MLSLVEKNHSTIIGYSQHMPTNTFYQQTHQQTHLKRISNTSRQTHLGKHFSSNTSHSSNTSQIHRAAASLRAPIHAICVQCPPPWHAPMWVPLAQAIGEPQGKGAVPLAPQGVRVGRGACGYVWDLFLGTTLYLALVPISLLAPRVVKY